MTATPTPRTPSRVPLDATDTRILRLLRANARASYRDIGADVGLSANAVTQRMRRMEQAGVIRGYTVVLDPTLEAAPLEAIVHLHATTDIDAPDLERAMAAVPGVVEILDLAGSIDYEVRLRLRTQVEIYEAVNALRLLPGITDMETRPILRPVLRR